MRRTKKLLLIGIGCAGLAIALLLAAVVTTHLLANRQRVKSYIVTKTAQATGGHLDYNRIEIEFLPLPHLAVQDVRLELPETFSLGARELAVYPRILAMLRGRLAIRRLRVDGPDIRVHIPRSAEQPPPAAKADDAGTGLIPAAIADQIGSVFSVLAAIDPGTQVAIDKGRLSVDFPDHPDLRIDAIQALADTTAHGLSIDFSCSSDLIDKLTVQATADVAHSQAKASIALTGINPQPIFSRLSLPDGITVAGTQARADLQVSISSPEDAKGRFRVQVPDLGINRDNQLLNLSSVSLSGTFGYEKNRLSLHLDKLASQQPALDLSATAVLVQDPKSGSANLQLSAGANQLDVAVIADLARSMAGDLASVRTAFDVARAGILSEPVYSAAFEYDQTGWHLKTMQATGRLSQGGVSISAINAEVQNVAGKIVYEDDHVDFLNLSGRFEGAAFEKLDVTIDWANQTTWAIQSSSVDVDAVPFFNWLSGFEALTNVKETVTIVGGQMALSKLKISGPLTAPGQWDLDVIASPRDLVLNTPQASFDITLSGGEIAYRADKVRSSGINVDFLDASFVVSHQLSGLVDPQKIDFQINGTLGPDATTWLNGQAPIPDHLQINPPVILSDVDLTWNHPAALSLSGEVKTAGQVALLVDFTYSPEELEIRKFQFSDGASKATISASKGRDAAMELTFSGNVNKQTADRLLTTNQILSGDIQGDFKARIDTDTPLNSTFVGKLSGNGLHFAEHARVPLTVSHFSIIGRGKQFDILPSEVVLEDMLMRVNGTFHPQDRALIFDINVDSDRLDVDLIQSLISDEHASPPADEEKPPPAMVPSGTIHFKTGSLTYGGFTWSPVSADIRIESGSTYVTIHQAQLCGISTPGDVDITPQGIGLNISPLATHASLQETSNCLWDKYVQVDARYDLVGNIVLMPTQKDPLTALSGRATFESKNGRIFYSSTLLKIFSVLNITELFTGGRSDLKKSGYGYSEAWVKARIEAGKLHLDEVLLDGNALKITGQGSIDLKAATADIIVLAAPLKTVDRLVNKLSIFRYITGGSLITVPMRVYGNLKDLSVVPLPPSAVGKGLLQFMERTLKSPFKLIEGTREAVSDRGREKNQAPAPTAPREP